MQISHKGVVSNADNLQKIKVIVTKTAACEHCLIKNSCQISSHKQNIEIEGVPQNSFTEYKKGEEVNVLIEFKHTFKALFFMYILPFLLLMLGLLLFSLLIFSEILIVAVALLILLLYYLILFIFRGKLGRGIHFIVTKIAEEK